MRLSAAGTRTAATAVVALAAGLGAVRVGAAPDVGSAHAVTAGTVLAASLAWGDVDRLEPGAAWWPELPQFNGGLEPGSPARQLVVAPYDAVDGSGRQILSAISWDATAAAAKRDYAKRAHTTDAGSKPLAGPAVRADEWRWFTQPDGRLVDTTLRFRSGAFVGRVTATDRQPWSANRIARLFEPVAARLGRLAAGTLQAPPPAASDLALLPGAPAAPGEPVVTLRLPPEAWATLDTSHKPLAVRSEFRRGGLRFLLYRRYRLAAATHDVVDVTLFPFGTAKGARAWVATFLQTLGKHPLDPGDLGASAGFTSNKGAFYELQFAQGRYAADVSCYAPFAKSSPACVSAVRALASRWYALLASR